MQQPLASTQNKITHHLAESHLIERPENITDSLWQWLQQRAPGEIKLRALNETDMSYTLVELVTENTALFIDNLPADLEQHGYSIRTLTLSLLSCGRNERGELETLDATQSDVAQQEVVVRMEITPPISPNRLGELESILRASVHNWSQILREHLLATLGIEQGTAWANVFASAFPASYREDFSALNAVSDIQHMMKLDEQEKITMNFYRVPEESEAHFRLKLFYHDYLLPLSSIIPMLENLGLQVISAQPYQVFTQTKKLFHIREFHLRYRDRQTLELDAVSPVLEETLKALWNGCMDNDGMNRLILSVGIGWRQVAMLRAYSRYFIQIKLGFSQGYVESVLMHNPIVTRQLVQLFAERFDPVLQEGSEQRESLLIEDINEALEVIENIDEDRILRRYLDMIQGTVRTTFYQTDAQGQFKNHVAYKFLPRAIPDLPKPLPLYEIFVHSPQMEGLYLRSGKISRGGIRYSDRVEDYRTEILVLMKTQQVKNSAIVPMGASGGFIVKNNSEWLSDQEQQSVILEGYRNFISGLLELTDNLVDHQVVQPEQVVCKDDDDYYLVISDDKGVRDFADLANSIAIERNFWLRDAFASGGSAGYDYKRMGITARGVWVAVEQHFRELGLDSKRQPISVMGIGNMSSDVFGNGMLLSSSIQLVAAFDQSHIFIDPNPDVLMSFQERQRLFTLPNSSWADYDKNLISSGGGVFSRHVKMIQTTSEMRQKLQVGALRLTPNELIHYLLKSPVDVLWNGSVGTYIKSAEESHTDVVDKANDNLRVDAAEVQAKIIAEGGNLGMTQLGRIEYAMRGGLSNTDFFDNAASVDCSDHEVNLKILLQDLLVNGQITNIKRQTVLKDTESAVAELVLFNHRRQIQAIGIARYESMQRIEEYRRYVEALDIEGKLDRELETIPSNTVFMERKISGLGLTRPELATLLAYCKNDLKEELMASSAPDDPYIARELLRLFPQTIAEQYAETLNKHQLKREMISTYVANHLVNFMGVCFVHRMKEASGASVSDIVKAYVAARDIFHLEAFWQSVEALADTVSEETQRALLLAYTQLIRSATAWLLSNKAPSDEISVSDWVSRYASGVDIIARELPLLLVGERLEIWEARFAEYHQLGFDQQLATWAAGIEGMTPVLAILQTAEVAHKPILDVAKIFYELGDRLNFYWFSQQIEQLPTENHWQALAKEGYRDELDSQQRRLTLAILTMPCEEAGQNVEENCLVRIRAWLNQYQHGVHRWRMLTHEFELSPPRDFAMYAVALRELSQLVA